MRARSRLPALNLFLGRLAPPSRGGGGLAGTSSAAHLFPPNPQVPEPFAASPVPVIFTVLRLFGSRFCKFNLTISFLN